MAPIFALVDCNNFYVSCERVFNPGLRGRPVVVLSNNDGCIIARSGEAKKLGIKMGMPCFQARPLIDKHGVVALSSNYALYGDMSRRVMNILLRFSPEMEVYSIDEAFLNLSGLNWSKRRALARKLKDTVYRWTGIPVSIGMAATKTLAKLAAHFAKGSKKAAGIVDLVASSYLEPALELTNVRDVWGVGGRTASRLERRGIGTALQLRDADGQWLRQKLGVNGRRLALELQGISCYGIEEEPPIPKSVRCSRSFREPVEDIAAMKEAMASYISRATFKIRNYGLSVSALTVFLRTSRFGTADCYYNSATIELPVSSQSTRELLGYALKAVDGIFRPGYRYKKAGVLLHGLLPVSQVQASMIDTIDRRREERLMSAVDGINSRLGNGIIRFAAEGLKQPWRSKTGNMTPAYTTRWSDIPVVK
ncbi:MAG: Y-family DNA polymerase [Pseudomonadota bacterium]|nr:Y-family DNA polymerase [Pseudomonadota bacterium]